MWRELDIQDGKVLLLSENIIMKRAYHSNNDEITWEDSELRNYLNSTFLASFTEKEQKAIIEVTNKNAENEWFETDGGEPTKDKIYLLSLEDTVNYFGDSGQRINRPNE